MSVVMSNHAAAYEIHQYGSMLMNTYHLHLFCRSWLKKAMAISILPFLLSACFASKPVYRDPPEAKGNDVLVMLFRPDSQTNDGVDSLFYLNDVNVARLSRNEYTWLHVPEGKYVLKHAWSNNPSDTMQTSISMQKESVYIYSMSTSNLNGNIRWLIAAHRYDSIQSALHESNYRQAIVSTPFH